jgi:hypothetical protein
MELQGINATHYCNVNAFNSARCRWDSSSDEICTKKFCLHYRRKWETPEQREERTKIPWGDLDPVYVRFVLRNEWRWQLMCYMAAKSYYETIGKDNMVVICANTDWGNPPTAWIPE